MTPAEDVSQAVTRALERIATVARPEVWIHLRTGEKALADAQAVQERLAAGEDLPLAGLTLAVKDNIDVAGLPTTAGCPAFAYRPVTDAPAVARLKHAGAIVLGKTNMDQFATGLAGTRTPQGAVRNAHDPTKIAGGSSAGSAVAVALGMADLALGTDTGGSIRVPAAFQGIVGFKPTRGLVSLRGVVPASRSFDCLGVFARDVATAELALAAMVGRDPGYALTRELPDTAPQAAPPTPRIAIASAEKLEGGVARALDRAVGRFRALGAQLGEIDPAPFLEASALLYGGFLAERYAAVGEFIAAHPDDVDPTVRQIVLGAKDIQARDYLADQGRLDALRVAARNSLSGFDALLLPTAPFHPTIAEATESPLEVDRALGVYCRFCNLLDMSAITLPNNLAEAADPTYLADPAEDDDDKPTHGLSLFAPAFHDRVLADLALRFANQEPPAITLGADQSVRLLAVREHMTGEPPGEELTSRCARLIGEVRTAPRYRLYRLPIDPPRPGLVRMDAFEHDAASIEGELWSVPTAGFASLVSQLPPQITVGPVILENGSWVTGFLLEPAAVATAQDITKFRGWRRYVEM